MSKVHKSLRIEQDTAAAITALIGEGETEAAAYNRVLSAGVKALTQPESPETEAEPPRAEIGGQEALIESLQSHIETLKAANAELSGQMAIKDRQIEALSVLTAQAQQTTTKALEQPKPTEGDEEQEQEKRRGLWAWLFG